MTGVGEAAAFRPEVGDDRLVVLRGNHVLLIKNPSGKSAGDTLAVDKKIAQAVLDKL